MKYVGLIVVAVFLGIFTIPLTLLTASELIYIHPITHKSETKWMDKYEPWITTLVLIGSITILVVPVYLLYREEKQSLQEVKK